MEFFDEKEEVVDLQLTQFGRHLLSKGRFQPVYYSFFDDDVLYNIESGGGAEEQNASHQRIYKAWEGGATGSGAPRMKSQISYNSLEKEFLNNYNKVLAGQEELGGKSQQPTAMKSYALPQQIGTIDVNKENAPAFQIGFLKGALTSSSAQLDLQEKTGGKTTLRIPQLESELTIEYVHTEDEGLYEMEDPSISFGVVTKAEDMYLFLKILEQNAPYQKKNFDIEVFEIINEEQGNNVIEELRPLRFNNPLEMIEEFDFIYHDPPPITQTNVEYYMDILSDDEVAEEICRLDPDNLSKGVFTDSKEQQCVDVLNEDERKLFDIYEDEVDDPGEVC